MRSPARRDRFIALDAELTEAGIVPVALLERVGAVQRSDAAGDQQAKELAESLRTRPAALAVERITGVTDRHHRRDRPA